MTAAIRRALPLIAAVAALVAVPGAWAAPAAPRAPLETVMQDDAQLLHRPPDQVRDSLARMRALGVDRVRVTANWSVLTRDADSLQKPAFDATDPAAYEQARWEPLDRVVRLAGEQGLRVMVDIAFWAPRWASADPAGTRGRTDIDPDAFAAFAAAVARRYSGTFRVPVDAEPVEPSEDQQVLDELLGGSGGDPDPAPAVPTDQPLPHVDVLTLWNEPNLPGFLRPQWVREGRHYRSHSAEVYRAMVTRAYPAIKAASPQATVLVGATSRSGTYSDRGTGGVPPLRFLRELACVGPRLHPLKIPSCRDFEPIPGDGWSHHPYSMGGTPSWRGSARQVDDVPMARVGRLARTLDRLVRAGRISSGLRDIWITEYGYETNPPSKITDFGVADQAHFLPWGEYLAWRVPQVRSYAQFLLRDLPPGPKRVGKSLLRPYGEWYSGLEYADGAPKPALDAFRAGLYVRRLARGRLRIWGRLRLAPGPRPVAVEAARRDGAPWVVVATRAPGGTGMRPEITIDGHGVLDRIARARFGRAARYRLRYAEDDGAPRYSPEVVAVGRARAQRRDPRARGHSPR